MMISDLTVKEDELIGLINELNKKSNILIEKKKEKISKLKESQSGILVSEYVKCGKKSCKCNLESYKHGPYWYYYYWNRGKLRKKYICPISKPNDTLNELNKRIENNKNNRIIQKEVKRIDKIISRINKIKEKFRNEVIQIFEII